MNCSKFPFPFQDKITKVDVQLHKYKHNTWQKNIFYVTLVSQLKHLQIFLYISTLGVAIYTYISAQMTTVLITY